MTTKKARDTKASGTRVQVPSKDLAELATVSHDVAERAQAERNVLEKRSHRNSHMDISNMNRLNHLVLVTLDEQRYALHLHTVTRVVRTVEITPLPKAPEIVRGVVNVQGQVIPVVNVRKRFRLPEREPELSDQLIIANTARRSIALEVDAVDGVIEHSGEEMIPMEKILPGTDYIEGVIKLEDGLVLIPDLDKFLPLEEDQELDASLKKKR